MSSLNNFIHIDLDAIRQALRKRRLPGTAYRAEWYDKRSRRWKPHRRHHSLKAALTAAESFCNILLDDVPYRVVNARTGLVQWERYAESERP